MKNDNAKSTSKHDGQSPEKGDLRRGPGPGEPKKAGVPDSHRRPHVRVLTPASSKPKTGSAASQRNEERHANKSQPEESGPGRASKTPPKSGRFEPR
jgi:hypothetical protein